MRRRSTRFADVVERQLDLFASDQADLIRETEEALARYNGADRDEAEELYGDYQDCVDAGRRRAPRHPGGVRGQACARTPTTSTGRPSTTACGARFPTSRWASKHWEHRRGGVASRMTQTLFVCDDFTNGNHGAHRRRPPELSISARTLLEDEGYAVVGEAENGVQALSAVAELHPDLVLLDVQLPDFDGFEIATRLKRNGSPSVVLASSRDADDFGTIVVECGALGFIPKAELSGEALHEAHEVTTGSPSGSGLLRSWSRRCARVSSSRPTTRTS